MRGQRKRLTFTRLSIDGEHPVVMVAIPTLTVVPTWQVDTGGSAVALNQTCGALIDICGRERVERRRACEEHWESCQAPAPQCSVSTHQQLLAVTEQVAQVEGKSLASLHGQSKSSEKHTHTFCRGRMPSERLAS